MERGLYIVPTPIGNLGDITQRALDVLREASVIAAEDTRHCGRLLSHFGITTQTTAYHEHSDERVAQRLCDRVEQGEAVALISDAGTPLVSDPGFSLVRIAQSRSLPVVPLPGACAAITALSGSGLSTARFLFEGFLPAKGAARRQRLEALQAQTATLVFYEAPHRIEESLADVVAIMGAAREAAIGRELTKQFETLHRAPVAELLDWVRRDENQRRGEIVLMVAGAEHSSRSQVDAQQLLLRLASELPPRRAAAIVADLTGEKARTLYQQLLDAGRD
jgi:16S rRNA (cytidine1402-2'-O)-methyltransferase